MARPDPPPSGPPHLLFAFGYLLFAVCYLLLVLCL
jgi:hypothetical protein